MVNRSPTPQAVALVLGLAAAVGLLTVLTFRWPPLAALDARLLPPPLDPTSAVAEIGAAFALLTWPGLQYGAILGVAVWAYQHRLRQLTLALCLVPLLGWGGVLLFKAAIRRPRPEQALDLLTSAGFGYPSSHVVAAVACSIAVGATFVATRQTARAKRNWQVGASALVLAVALDRWLLGAHYLTDILAGVLFGAAAAALSLVIAGVAVPVPQVVPSLVIAPDPAPPVDQSDLKTCAVVYNPAKITDWVTFRRHVEYELKVRGWRKALWLETTEADPGHAMTRQAVEAGVDLVLGAGGDGTIRVVCAGLAQTGIPFGLIPAGTGNLLARNVGIPLDEAAALGVAFEGADVPVDLVRLTVDPTRTDEHGHPVVDHFVVMAGIGIDAVIMQSTRPQLKKAVGSAAYFVSAAENANYKPMHATIQVDDQPVLRRRASVIVVGNVGFLQVNIPLIPDAKPDDGILDVVVASPRTPRDWLKLTARVLTRQQRTDEQLDRLTGQRVTITLDERESYQMDGDTVGECNTMVAEVQPGALLLRLPRQPGSDEPAVPSAAEAQGLRSPSSQAEASA